ncbi:hypothetical protein AB4254_08505 [Vibrio breoganii]
MSLPAYSPQTANDEEKTTTIPNVSRDSIRARCAIDAKRFKKPSEWRSSNPALYVYAKDMKLIDELFPNNDNTILFESCRKSATRYTEPSHWFYADQTRFILAIQNGWYDSLTAHMEKNYKRHVKHWNIKECTLDAAPYKTPEHWSLASYEAYETARSNGWLHTVFRKKPLVCQRIPWSLEEVRYNASLYKHYRHWATENPLIESIAVKNDWLVEICKHMLTTPTKNSMQVSVEHALNIAYSYTNRSDFETNEPNIVKVLVEANTYDNVHFPSAKRRTSYKRKYTFERCLANALQYTTIKEWRTQDSHFYDAALRNDGWVPACTTHMLTLPRGRYSSQPTTLHQCIQTAFNCFNFNDWRRDNPKMHRIAVDEGWIHDVTAHMPEPTPISQEDCIRDAYSYPNEAIWLQCNPSAHNLARERGWINPIRIMFHDKNMELRGLTNTTIKPISAF